MIHLTTITHEAERFCQLYGNRFLLVAQGSVGVVIMIQAIDRGRAIRVERIPDGIFVDGQLFCKTWENKDEND